MADPQHPAVPFEQAVDLLTGEPRQLRPQHPDIAALVEELGGYANLLRMLHPKQNEKSAALVDRTIAALRTLARPVEPIEPVEPTEPTAEDEEMVAGLIGFLRDDLAPACQREGCRLARPVEDEDEEVRQLDALRAEFDQLFGRFTDESTRATRAEQEAARLRDALENIAEDRGTTWPEAKRIAERALAAAAGAEEPR